MPPSLPQRIFREACDAVGAGLTPLGFRYLKSKRSCARTSGAWTVHLRFATSSTNVLPKSVSFQARVLLSSGPLGDWRRERGLDRGSNPEFLFGVEVENVTRPAPPYVRYSVFEPAERARVIARVIEVMKTEVLPLAEFLGDLPALCAAVEQGRYPCLKASSVDLFLAAGREDLAERFRVVREG